jgi:hypothetical protein
VCADSCSTGSQCNSGCCASASLGSVCAPLAACESCGNPGNGSCTTAGNLFCGSACCSPSYPFYCASTNTCYATQFAATSACGTSCNACVTATAVCIQSSSGYCNGGGEVYCGSSTCCSASMPFYCASNNMCYATSNQAAAVCNSSCVRCGSATIAGCIYAVTGTCSAAGNVYCTGTTCCPSGLPYYCASTNLCYQTPQGAENACGPGCYHCH